MMQPIELTNKYNRPSEQGADRECFKELFDQKNSKKSMLILEVSGYW
jgi:hypothetical protein